MTAITCAPVETGGGVHVSHAYVRKPGAAFGDSMTDTDRAAYQHDAYCRTLMHCGVEVRALLDDPLHPANCAFADTAVLAGRLAVLTTSEHAAAATPLLAGSRDIHFLTPPARLNAADIARIGSCYFIALTARTNSQGAFQLAALLTAAGFEAHVLDLGERGDNLRDAVCDLGGGRILLCADLEKNYAFLGYDAIMTESAAAAVMVNGTLLIPTGHGAAADEAVACGVPAIEVQMSEFTRLGYGPAGLALCLPASRENVVRFTPGRRVA